MASANGGLPLRDLRVLELGHIVAGPSAGLILADLGADVIKIERPDGGDQARRMPGGVSAVYYFLNRNKRSFAVDLKAPAGKALFLRLVQSADVVLDNFAPGALDGLGLSYAALAEANPRLIYLSVKGFLPGPYEQRPSLDGAGQEALDRQIDQPRVGLGQRGVAQAQPVERARREVVQHHVGALDQPQEESLARRRLEVDGEA